ncbi:MAG: dephospho-CoA kinase [Bacteroidales bacterium]
MRLGITGGIGSGKTIISRIFTILGVPVFSADDEAKEIMTSDKLIMEQIIQAVGKNVYRNGILQRKELAKMIFNDKNLLEKINRIVHPAVFKRFTEWEKQQNYPYVIMEAAILFESRANTLVDKVLTVVAPENERIKRVMERDNIREKEVADRIRNQYDDDFRISRSDYVIDNSGNKLIIPEILKIHSEMLFLSNKKKE